MTTVADEKKRIDYLLQRDKATDKQLEKVYRQASADLRSVMLHYTSIYAVDGTLVPGKLSKRPSRKDLQLIRDAYAQLPDDLPVDGEKKASVYVSISALTLQTMLVGLLGLTLLKSTPKAIDIVQADIETATKEELAYQIQVIKETNRAKLAAIKRKAAKIASEPSAPSAVLSDGVKDWRELIWLDHDRLLTQIAGIIDDGLKKGMTAKSISDAIFPGAAADLRSQSATRAVIQAFNSAKRVARTQAAAREDEVAQAAFEAEKVKYFRWVTEPGACKKCLALEAGSPYEVADGPRIPADSHPNCRCRRMPVAAEN